MPSTDIVSKRRSMSRQTRQAALRSQLFSHYRKDPRYQLLVEENFRPLWHTFEGDMRRKFGESLAFHPHFGHMLAAVVGHPNSLLEPFPGVPTVDSTGQIVPPPGRPPDEQLDQLELYVVGVLQHVKSSLGLSWQGKPALWAVQFVHMDVTQAPTDLYDEPGLRQGDDELDRASVQVTVGPGWARGWPGAEYGWNRRARSG